ncbi:MAG: D-glycero-beta-D-manno-heptose 1-phosphate adenylyltransferase [Cyclobacteriaceae bacterium]|nr:D-glycero-beta-D-manno-heptose 1-phosphate adenylyltransferase [Cyclobacteriaceae bacterium]
METKNKILPLEEALPVIDSWKEQGSKVVFTNGCFDILHIGHVDYLEKARNTGDKLIIGLNTDLSVRILKGAGRPVNDEISRGRLLAALSFVDMVILFNEDTPLELISAVKPDILVKGNDYEIKNIVGANFVMENGGKVITLDLIVGVSTTSIINKIKNA